MQTKIETVLKNFKIDGDLLSAERYGEGHINDTYKVVYSLNGQEKKYILQRISKRLTNDIPALMKNIEYVTEFNRKSVLSRGGNPEREGLLLLRTLKNECFFFDGEDYYRIYLFIDNATSHQSVTDPKYFYEAAVAFGNFFKLLADFDASLLSDTIPNFHHTPTRFNNFLNAVSVDKLSRATGVQREIDWLKSRAHYIDKITSLLESGQMPYRVTHNDTKLNNVMIDDKSGKGIAVIDLDTVMKGSLCYDFGDSIRFGCNPCSEDEKDLSKVNFRLDLFETFAKGYLSAVGDSITQVEKDNLALGAIMMTFECGMRFLTDYLMGDVYFHTKYHGQNLDRARTQFKLVEDMEQLLPEMEKIIRTF